MTDNNLTRARRQMTDDDIREMGEMYEAGWKKKDLVDAFRVGGKVVDRSIDYYYAHLKHQA